MGEDLEVQYQMGYRVRCGVEGCNEETVIEFSPSIDSTHPRDDKRPPPSFYFLAEGWTVLNKEPDLNHQVFRCKKHSCNCYDTVEFPDYPEEPEKPVAPENYHTAAHTSARNGDAPTGAVGRGNDPGLGRHAERKRHPLPGTAPSIDFGWLKNILEGTATYWEAERKKAVSVGDPERITYATARKNAAESLQSIIEGYVGAPLGTNCTSKKGL